MFEIKSILLKIMFLYKFYKIKPIYKGDKNHPINKIDFVYVTVVQVPDDIKVLRFIAKE